MEAWYTADASASVTPLTAAAGSLTVGESTGTSTNEFTITPTAVNTSASVVYTDAAGKTYVSIPKVGGGYSTVEGNVGADAVKAVAIPLKATVTYSGDLTVAADVQALWLSKISTVTLTVSCTAVGGSVVEGSAAAQVSDIRGVSSTDANDSGPLALSKNDSDFTWSSAASTGEVNFGTVYVALTGSDSLIVDATHLPTYTLQIAATYVA